MSAPIRVVIVDDQDLVRTGFGLVLEAEPGIEVVGEASTGVEAVTLVAAVHPDVVLMDVRMPELDGIEATRRILARPRNGVREAGGVPAKMPSVIVLTTFDLDEYVLAALAAGASGFLLKDASRHELVSAIRRVHDGDVVLAPAVTRRVVAQLLDQPARAIDAADAAALDELTDREREVFGMMATGASNAEIAAALFVSESTVKTHVGRVLSKTGARDRVHAVLLAHRLGIASDDVGRSSS